MINDVFVLHHILIIISTISEFDGNETKKKEGKFLWCELLLIKT